MTSTFKTAALLLPAHLASSAPTLALTTKTASVTVHWLLPTDNPGLAALSLVESLTPASACSSGAADAAVAAQRAEEVAEWGVVAPAAAALPGLSGLGADAPLALLAAAGSLRDLAAADARRLVQWCGGDAQLAEGLAAFFGAAG